MYLPYSSQKMKFSVKDFFSNQEVIGIKLRICSHLLKNSLRKNLIFFAVIPCQPIIFTTCSCTLCIIPLLLNIFQHVRSIFIQSSSGPYYAAFEPKTKNYSVNNPIQSKKIQVNALCEIVDLFQVFFVIFVTMVIFLIKLEGKQRQMAKPDLFIDRDKQDSNIISW